MMSHLNFQCIAVAMYFYLIIEMNVLNLIGNFYI